MSTGGRPTVRDVVALIVGGGYPEPLWLEGRLSQTSRLIRAYVEGEEAAPLRTEMRARLEAFRTAVMLMKDELSDVQFVTYLGNDWSELPAGLSDVTSALSELADRAGLLANKFSGQKGAGKAYPTDIDDTISSKQLCMWTVMQAMKRCRGLATVSAINQDAWNAANALYRMSGGCPMGGGSKDGEPSGWGKHITSVQNIEAETSKRAAHLVSLALMFEARTPNPVEI